MHVRPSPQVLFNSVEFAFFFPVAIAGYFALPQRWRWAWLLAASYLFYGWWKVEYLGLLALSTLVDYTAGLRMGRLSTRAARRPWLLLSLASNGAILIGFKYFDFFGETVNSFVAIADQPDLVPALGLLLPVGISFYTFQTLAYSIDVYRGDIEPERHLGHFALYISFWPQLVAGPIERARRLLPQFREEHAVDPVLVLSGLRLMAWGLFLKTVLTDRLAPFVSHVFDAPEAFGAGATWAALHFAAIQFYGDFGGYSLIAVGAARTMGFRLTTNFREPLLAPTMRDFWTRWHVTLMTWLRDYIYRPVVGANRTTQRRRGALLLMFLASGLWHGAAWTFVLWGAALGLYVLAEGIVAPHLARAWGRLGAGWSRAGTVLATLITYHVFVSSAVLFRAGSLADTAVLAASIAGLRTGTGQVIDARPNGRYELGLALLVIGIVFAVDVANRWPAMRAAWGRLPIPARGAAYAWLVLSIILFGEFGARPFLYFQF